MRAQLEQLPQDDLDKENKAPTASSFQPLSNLETTPAVGAAPDQADEPQVLGLPETPLHCRCSTFFACFPLVPCRVKHSDMALLSDQALHLMNFTTANLVCCQALSSQFSYDFNNVLGPFGELLEPINMPPDSPYVLQPCAGKASHPCAFMHQGGSSVLA